MMKSIALSATGVASMCQRNKKDYQLTLHDGQQLQLAVTDMFSVAVFRQGQALLHIRFKPLSSLNNLEMQPVYQVASLQVAGVAGMHVDGLPLLHPR